MYTSLTTAINPRPYAPMPLGAKVAEVLGWTAFWLMGVYVLAQV